jgi:hypothetical protein
VQPQRLGIADQFAKDAVTSGAVANEPNPLVFDSDGDEMAQAPVFADHAESPVPCTDKLARRLHHTLKHRLEGEVPG